MSAVPTEIELNEAPRQGERRLPPIALVYYVIVAAAAIAAAAPFVRNLSGATHGWITFAILAACTAVAQLFVVVTPRRGRQTEASLSYHTTAVFLLPVALLLSPALAALVAIVQHLPEWLKKRQAWYIGTFNIFNYTLTILAALGANRLVVHQHQFISNHALRVAIGGLAACLVFTFVNHALLAQMFRLGRGVSYTESGLFTFESLSAEMVLAMLGVGVATFWHTNPWLIPLALAPLILIHRSLSVPALQMEARVDPKTGLFNARHFAAALAEELARAQRFGRPMSLIMADLDLLREINNNYGHLAGDAVLKGIADVFRQQLRHYDIPARFGGEEFSILLPETPPEQALEIAERIRRAVADSRFEVETSSEPIRATVSIGVAGYPKDGKGANELIHQADLAVYRAKLQGRNRVLGVSSEPLLLAEAEMAHGLVAVPAEEERFPSSPGAVSLSVPATTQLPRLPAARDDERRNPRPHSTQGPRFFELSFGLGTLVALVSTIGIGAGIAGLVFGSSRDVIGLLVVVGLVGGGQALALELDEGAISVSAVGTLAGVALFGPRAALVLAVATVAVDWSARRIAMHHVMFNIGALSVASLGAAGVFGLAGHNELVVAGAGLVAGALYFAVNMGLLSLAVAVEGGERWVGVFKERFAWLLPHYVVYGFIGGVMAIAYHAAGLYALAVFTVPLLLMRKTQEAYLSHTRRSASKLREAAETIQSQNVSLEQANRLLKERSTAAMESLSATVDARDSYTAGHSRRVQQLALAVGRELGLSQAELDLLGHAALFHDIGKLAIPDAILLKPASLTQEEWALMQSHAEEGARIIDRLGFLGDAVPAIRHHHERFDGTGYPDRLKGEEIPLGARIIHVADALDSMLTTRIYRAARPASEALDELRRAASSQFCPRCVGALERVLAVDSGQTHGEPRELRTATAELVA
jgi:diguanylate cyclase (GGDEF)-like protein/putative nucleotidyltransferase with HDIG domain